MRTIVERGERKTGSDEAKPPGLLNAVSYLPVLLAGFSAAFMLATVLQLFSAYSAYSDRMDVAAIAVMWGMALVCVGACVFAAWLYRETQRRRRAGCQARPPSPSTLA
jgi:hypothetical protein